MAGWLTAVESSLSFGPAGKAAYNIYDPGYSFHHGRGAEIAIKKVLERHVQ